MKTIYKTVFKYLGVLIVASILTTSCEDYLDKSPKVNITEESVFSKFITFQGFMEEDYQCIVDQSYGTAGTMNFNFGDDIVLPGGATSGFTSPEFDRGNYWEPLVNRASVFCGDISSVTNGSDKGYWQNGWYGIRIANLALGNVNKLISGTDEERNLIKGQAYFFRGYLHFEILRSWGGIPYIDTFFTATDVLRRPRLSYKQTADKINADLQKAAQLLPVSWDETVVGQVTLGQNAGRLTKGAAWGYIGKNLLYAASPLMNGLETGSYDYNIELCKQAAEAFNEVIKLVNQYPQYLGLETWANYKNNFYTISTINIMPKGKEIVFSSPYQTAKTSGQSTGEHVLSNFGGFGVYAGPTENYIENFGMDNGLPIDAVGSGYNASDPWVNRDPRFYYSVWKDRDPIIINPPPGNLDATFQSYVGGRHRSTLNSATGYGEKKFIDIGCNPYDKLWSTYSWEVTQLRLVDVYLMYAEAVNEAFGPTTVPSNIPGGITAQEAVNIVRRRVEVTPGVSLPDVDVRYLNKDAFREIIRQERAVELCFEGHRWYDLRRWHVSHLLKYREKYSLDFPQDHSSFKKVLWVTTVFEDKHYWLPFPVDQVTLYPEFKQNPGW